MSGTGYNDNRPGPDRSDRHHDAHNPARCRASAYGARRQRSGSGLASGGRAIFSFSHPLCIVYGESLMEYTGWCTSDSTALGSRQDNEFCAKVGITACTDNVVSEAAGRKLIFSQATLFHSA